MLFPDQTQDGGMLYALAEKEYLRAFRYHLPAAHVDEQPAATAMSIRASDGMPGGALSISANGNRDGVVWVSVHKTDAITYISPGRLAAFDATTLKELWRDDDVPFFAKFNPPTVADGKVFLPTFAQPDAAHPRGLGWLIVYGIK
jgi:outer membrane protein assembly factor BamB